MPRKCDFEEKYKAQNIQPFNQGDEMWKRPRRDIELREVGKAFYKHQLPKAGQDITGRTLPFEMPDGSLKANLHAGSTKAILASSAGRIKSRA